MFFLFVFGVLYMYIFTAELVPMLKGKKYRLFAINVALLVITCALQYSLVLELGLPSMTSLFLKGFDYLFIS